VRREEGDQRRLCVQPESVVVEVDGVEVRKVEYRGEERGECFGDFAEQAASEDVGKIGDLENSIRSVPGACITIRCAVEN